ncbi:PREDICTED: increased DNA methylation 3-like [Ipomoea nil]|uniref:increased DNA methylation 3-like n=1 Tax=Ipomoea nil TaxID=35883 RepID=UPI000900B597|nr:PREDICTED: increased DNA methylation 3-like [Ipomoea nil]XP_019172161.1 PREDICTED: increased DNA methylation 3-like [Ipomoea nil]
MDALRSEKKGKKVIGKNSKQNLNGENDSPQVEVEGYSRRSNLERRPCMMPLLPIPNMESSSKASLILSGTACKGVTGPPIGAFDIGVSKSAYYFRVALPGVKRDPGDFNCEIERDGMVHIRGVTSTGGKTVSKYYRVFAMTHQQQCPPGAFTLSFRLPGPVDPRLFSPNFGCDGIFEGVVAKYSP